MLRLGRSLGFMLGLSLIATGPAFGQGNCLNPDLYPSNAIVPDPNGTETSISACSFEQEYSQVTGIYAGGTYRFTINNPTSYITVRQGTYDGPVVGQGVTPVEVTAVDAGDLFAHWNTDSNCGLLNTCRVTTVQWLLNCTPPQASATLVENCADLTFTVVVDVASTGDGSSVNVVWDVFGNVESLAGVGTGTYELGPFYFGDEVVVSVEHASDPMCNRSLGLFRESGECPLPILCGFPAQSFSYCYSNNEAKVWNYESQGGSGSLVLTFISGNIETYFNDQLTIYDGLDASGPILFQHTLNGIFNLSGLTVASTTGQLHMVLTTNGLNSCNDGSQQLWNWKVECLNCQLPAATATSVDDCPNNQFSIPVNVTSIGDAASVTISYAVNGQAPVFLDGVGLGITTLGPFTVNDLVSVYVQHSTDPACTVALGVLTDQGNCPNLITCGNPPLEETYCYTAFENRSWSYQALGTGTLRLTFHQGTIESSTWDHLRIYDGTDNTGTLLFDHVGGTSHLGPQGSASNNTYTNYYGLQFYSASGAFYMELTSDGSVQCGSSGFDPWDWDVVCLDCTIPQGTVTVVDDCANHEFSLDVDVTSTGDAATATIIYMLNGGAAQTITGATVGITTLGPFAFGDVVNVVLAHESNSLCDMPKGNFTDTGTCPTLIDCGSNINASLCYTNSQDARYYYRSTGTAPLRVYFSAGTVYAGDLVYVYDGGDINAPILYQGNGNNTNMAGLFFTSTNAENRLTIRIVANTFTDCATSTPQNPVAWTVGCLDCTSPAATFSIVQDCANSQYFVAVNVTAMGSDPVIDVTNSGTAPALTVSAVGTYQVGPFATGTPVQVTLVNDANSLCNVYSGTLVNPLCPTILCGATPLAQDYCYGNNESRAWAYEAPTPGATLRLRFLRGTIESNTFDRVTIYDGNSTTGTILFAHSNTTSYNLGPSGSAVLSTGSPYYAVDVTTTTGNLYMTLTTDASVSCASSTTTYDSWQWEVTCNGCSAPGVSYNLVRDCLHRQYKAEVIVTQAPSASGMTIVNASTGDSQTANATGIYEFGPYANNSVTNFAITDLSLPACVWQSGALTVPTDSCVIRSCGPTQYDYCYENNEDRWYTYRSTGTTPMAIVFQQGQLLTGDRIYVYNGFDETASLIYQGTNGGNLTGFAVNSQNPNYAITLRIKSDASGSCADGQATVPLRWVAACGTVGMEELAHGGFAVYPNPTEGLLYIVAAPEMQGLSRVRVLDMSGRVALETSLNMRAGSNSTIDMSGLQTGQYMVQVTTADRVRTQRIQVAR